MNSVQSRRNGLVIFVAALVAALGLACALGLPAQKAYADVFLSSDNTWVVSPVEDDTITGGTFIEFVDEDGYWLDDDDLTITNIKSSNKKVARLSKSGGWLSVEYGMTIGKTTLSFTVNGKSFKHVFQVKYTCPVSKFKVAGKSVLKTFKKKNIFVTKNTIKNKKVVVKTKKNWVITKVCLVKNDKSKSKTFTGKRKYSAKISTVMPYDGITLYFKNTKTGEEQVLTYRKYYDIRYAQAG